MFHSQEIKVRKLIAVGCFLALFSLVAIAQEGSYPKSEVFAGYQYTRMEGTNANGYNFAFNGNFNEWFGITGDFSGAYRSEGGISFHNYTYTFGPVISLRTNKAFTPFAHALIGGDHASASATGFGSATGNGFAMMAGGGVDFNINPHMAFRAAQADWMLLHSSGSTSSKNARISTGIVFKF
jgi:opacity protein-like surface antigen